MAEGSYPKMERLIRTSHATHCPHKGHATYYSLYEAMSVIRELLAFYPDKVDAIDCV